MNILTIEKLDNDVFSYELNGDTVNKILNSRNDLFTIGDITHWKTANGANIIKEQDVNYANVTLIDGVTTIIPTSVTDLFDQLTALGFFDWFKSTGSGVNRFDDLLDTFEYAGKTGQFVIVAENELQLTTVVFTPITESIGLSDMPGTLVPGKMLKVNPSGTAYEFVDPPAGANGYISSFVYASPDPQEFTLATSSSLIMVIYNGAILSTLDWSQTSNTLTILPTVTLVDGDQITALGVI